MKICKIILFAMFLIAPSITFALEGTVVYVDSSGVKLPRALRVRIIGNDFAFVTCDFYANDIIHCLELIPNEASHSAYSIRKGYKYFRSIPEMQGSKLAIKIDQVFEFLFNKDGRKEMFLAVEDKVEVHKIETALRMILAKDMRVPSCVEYLTRP